jgi:hypothetical protein
MEGRGRCTEQKRRSHKRRGGYRGKQKKKVHGEKTQVEYSLGIQKQKHNLPAYACRCLKHDAMYPRNKVTDVKKRKKEEGRKSLF